MPAEEKAIFDKSLVTPEDGDDEASKFRQTLDEEFDEKFESCITKDDVSPDEKKFCNFQKAMDDWAVHHGINRRSTCAGDRFKLYWNVFSSLTKEEGVKKQDIIEIRRQCGMFGANKPDGFVATLCD